MFQRLLNRLWTDIKTDAQKFWAHLKHVAEHPWDSLCSRCLLRLAAWC